MESRCNTRDRPFAQETTTDRLRTASCTLGSCTQAYQRPSPQPSGSA